MDIKKMFDENEKPLDNLVSDGGFMNIFRSVACIGDSLSSGEFESCDSDGNKGYHDMYEYSWGQFIARTCGSTVYNFSRGGLTAKVFFEEGHEKGWFDPKKASQAYIFALGVNDLFGWKMPVGTVTDHKEDDTFAGYYIELIRRFREIQPNAKFFLMTMPLENNKEHDEVVNAHAELLCEIAKTFDNTYVLDLRKYAPVYDEFFKSKFYLHGHLNPMGYQLTAKMVTSYIDWIIRQDPNSFKRVPYIGTNVKDTD